MDKKTFDEKLKTAMGIVKDTPKMSVNKLGEYLVATPYRQRKILEGLKYPKEEGGGWGQVHGETRHAIKQFFSNDMDESLLDDCLNTHIDRLETENQKRTDNSSILLLEKIIETDFTEIDSLSFKVYTEKKNTLMDVEGVKISVYPDLIVDSTIRGKDSYGLMTVHLGTSTEMNEEGGKYIASVLHRYAEEHFEDNRELRTDHCIAYDVFTGNIITCPNGVKNRWKNIEAACKTISTIWDSI